uniref:Uncharacterized protein n=1 Tax=Arundo donax TaxID=35708 RepID=A0A0A9GM35_ARUDO
MPGDSGNSALGENAGEIRGPNVLVSGGFNGFGAGLGNTIAWRAETARSRSRSWRSNPPPTRPISARDATALPGWRIWKRQIGSAAVWIDGERATRRLAAKRGELSVSLSLSLSTDSERGTRMCGEGNKLLWLLSLGLVVWLAGWACSGWTRINLE